MSGVIRHHEQKLLCVQYRDCTNEKTPKFLVILLFSNQSIDIPSSLFLPGILTAKAFTGTGISKTKDHRKRLSPIKMVNSIDKISRPIDSENVPSQPKPKRRRKSGDIVALSKHLKKDRRVAWAGNPKVNQRGDLHELFNDYKENDIWYTVSASRNDFFVVC